MISLEDVTPFKATSFASSSLGFTVSNSLIKHPANKPEKRIQLYLPVHIGGIYLPVHIGGIERGILFSRTH